MAKISQDFYQGLNRITVENELLLFSILPEVGGKMISLFSKPTQQEFMSLSGRTFTKLDYGKDYGDCDISGFDECFPGIASGFYPEWPWKGTHIPDHGELFTLPWKTEIRNDSLNMQVYGIRFPYKFSKTIFLDQNTVKINYELENVSPYDFKYIWSAHPLFAVEKNTKIKIPGKPNVRTDYSKYERFGKHLYETSWPNAKEANGDIIDVSVIRSEKEDAATKFFTTKLEEGWCALEYPQGSVLKMTFDVEKVPYVGLWINEGGWSEGNSFHVAMEPCTGCPDKLETAIQRGENAIIKGYTKKFWNLDITINN